MKQREVTITAKASAEYQTVSRTVTFDIEESDDPIELERKLQEHRDALQESVLKDLQALLRKIDERQN